MEKYILMNLFCKDIKKREVILETYFDWCYSGNSNDKYFQVYKGNIAYYNSENDLIYLSDYDYFKEAILENNDFIEYIKKYYDSWFKLCL